ncbi:hypothetical protein GEMRC1_011317 [Eukaryota sp. GEM-RC1]
MSSFKHRFSGKISVVTKTGGLAGHITNLSAQQKSKNFNRGPHSAVARLGGHYEDFITKKPLPPKPLTHRPTVSDLSMFVNNDRSSQNQFHLPSVSDSSSFTSIDYHSFSKPQSSQSVSLAAAANVRLGKKVDYEPYTLEDYRRIAPKQYIELGKLQPNLETDEHKAKKEKYDRMKQYGSLYTEHNKAMPKRPSIPKKPPKPKSKEKSLWSLLLVYHDL